VYTIDFARGTTVGAAVAAGASVAGAVVGAIAGAVVGEAALGVHAVINSAITVAIIRTNLDFDMLFSFQRLQDLEWVFRGDWNNDWFS
jgi:hypothetical protein